MTTHRLVAGIALSMLLSGSTLSATLSPKYIAWPAGPVQWLMTADEKAAWLDVKTDEEGQRLIDLFWARRDPTPGTPRNEYREMIAARIADADKFFKFGEKRGSMTDAGRVYIVLGPPDMSPPVRVTHTFSRALASSSGGTWGVPEMVNAERGGVEARRPTLWESWSLRDGTARQSGFPRRREFSYRNHRAMGLTGGVVFIENPTTHEIELDPRSHVDGAIEMAVKKTIVNPNLNEVPEWAKQSVAEAAMAKIIATGPTEMTRILPPDSVAQPTGPR
jgi:GWxTD domain-containing protein